MSLECPSCHCHNVQKLSIVYASGISSGTSVGVGVSSGGGVGIGTAKNSFQTELSKSAAPPTLQPNNKYGLVACGVVCFIISLGAVYFDGPAGMGFISFCGGIFFVVLSQTELIKRLDDIADSQHNAWAKTFMCQACGHRFIP